MQRIYQPLIQHHLANLRQMVFLSGPRQVGKTTLSQACVASGYVSQYFNWGSLEHREWILSGIEKIYQR